MHFPPVILRICIALPEIRNADTTGKPNLPVDDQDATVSAPIDPIDPPRPRWMIISKHTPGVLHRLYVFAFQFLAGTNAIEQHANLDTRTSAFTERVAEFAADLTRVKEERLEVNARLRRTDLFHHRWENLHSIMQQFDFVPDNRDWIG